MIAQGRALLRAIALYLWTAAMVAAYGASALVSRRLTDCLPRVWHSGVCAIAGLDCCVHGQAAEKPGVLYLANHVSYLDIIVLGATLRAGFVAKAEVRRWPVIGWLAVLQDTVFVERRTARTAAQCDAIGENLANGGRLVLFPEGTSSDGTQVLPFRSALIDAACRTPGVIVQPASLAYTHVNGRPLDSAMRDRIAWYGAMELAGHLWAMLGLGRIGVTVRFHPPLPHGAFVSRKEIAAEAHRVVAGGLAAAMAEVHPLADPRPADLLDEPNLAMWPPFD